MTKESRLSATTSALSLLILLSTSSALAVSPVVKTAGGDLLLSTTDGRQVVQQPDGQRVELPLSAAAGVSDFRAMGDRWLVAAVSRTTDGSHRLELFQGGDGKVTALPSPALEPTTELMQPIFIADHQGFQALVWLAGDAHHQLAVKASRWLAGGWSAPETLSPPGPGTQIAPTTAILADGSWLVAWAAYDGEDDEILWSRFANGAWTQPQSIAKDNAVPDITPHLFVSEDGALAAWSRFDGKDYRVHVARFDGKRWSTPTVAGPAGSTNPAFSNADDPFVIYHHADPPGWAVMQLDPSGTVLRQATLEIRAPRRPVLASVSNEAVQLEWLSADQQKVSAPAAWIEQ